jgi:hypothetical protein
MRCEPAESCSTYRPPSELAHDWPSTTTVAVAGCTVKLSVPNPSALTSAGLDGGGGADGGLQRGSEAGSRRHPSHSQAAWRPQATCQPRTIDRRQDTTDVSQGASERHREISHRVRRCSRRTAGAHTLFGHRPAFDCGERPPTRQIVAGDRRRPGRPNRCLSSFRP